QWFRRCDVRRNKSLPDGDESSRVYRNHECHRAHMERDAGSHPHDGRYCSNGSICRNSRISDHLDPRREFRQQPAQRKRKPPPRESVESDCDLCRGLDDVVGGLNTDDHRRGKDVLRIFATTVKPGSTTLAISYSAAWPMKVCAPRSVI